MSVFNDCGREIHGIRQAQLKILSTCENIKNNIDSLVKDKFRETSIL